MTDFLQRLKQRKLVQWALAYIAAAFALLQGLDVVAQQFGWPEGLQRELNAQKRFDPFRTECIDKLEMAQIQAVLGDAGAALEALDWLLARPTGNHISVPMLKLDPTWGPIRKNPRFQALLKKYVQ